MNARSTGRSAWRGRWLVAAWLAASAPPLVVVAEVPAVVGSRAQIMLIRNALAALNHANITGNYAVLRDLGSDGFRRRLTAADLAQAFSEHRARRLDLSPALACEPLLTEPVGELSGERLRLVGYFPTEPEVIGFAVSYQRTERGWALDELSVSIIPAAGSTWTRQ